ncbi:hypothetical protein EDEG_01141, partial [Edhazardia aedis USNM 41457]
MSQANTRAVVKKRGPGRPPYKHLLALKNNSLSDYNSIKDTTSNKNLSIIDDHKNLASLTKNINSTDTEKNINLTHKLLPNNENIHNTHSDYVDTDNNLNNISLENKTDNTIQHKIKDSDIASAKYKKYTKHLIAQEGNNLNDDFDIIKSIYIFNDKRCYSDDSDDHNIDNNINNGKSNNISNNYNSYLDDNKILNNKKNIIKSYNISNDNIDNIDNKIKDIIKS